MGVILTFIPLGIGSISVRKLRKRSQPLVESEWQELLNSLAQKLNLRRKVSLLQHADVTMPITWGVQKPVVLLPANVNSWPNGCQRMVLLHELAHVKRLDCLAQALAWVACAIYWFNPLVWLAIKKLYAERERACDDLVVSSGSNASDYADHLLEVARSFRWPFPTSVAAVPMAKASQLEGRLLDILDDGKKRSSLDRLSASVTLFVAIGLVGMVGGCRTPTRSLASISSGLDLLPSHDLVAGKNPSDLAQCDFNGDGKPDLVAVNYLANTISIFKNISATDGRIRYAPRIDFPTGRTPIVVCVQDLDGDDKPEVVVANHYGASLSIFHNASSGGDVGDKTFSYSFELKTGRGPCGVGIRDLNGDGKPDLVVAITGHSSNDTIMIFENTSVVGDISFAEPVQIQVGMHPVFVALEDIDGDGSPDIIVSNHRSYSFSVLRNLNFIGAIASSSFAKPQDFPVGGGLNRPYRIAVADFDGDGRKDLVVSAPNLSNDASNGIFVIFQNTSSSGNCDFVRRADFQAGKGTAGLTVTDVNGDQWPDIVMGNLFGNTVSAWVHRGGRRQITPGMFHSKVEVYVGQGASGVVVADLNGDGQVEFAVANEKESTISFLRQQSGP